MLYILHDFEYLSAVEDFNKANLIVVSPNV